MIIMKLILYILLVATIFFTSTNYWLGTSLTLLAGVIFYESPLIFLFLPLIGLLPVGLYLFKPLRWRYFHRWILKYFMDFWLALIKSTPKVLEPNPSGLLTHQMPRPLNKINFELSSKEQWFLKSKLVEFAHTVSKKNKNIYDFCTKNFLYQLHEHPYFKDEGYSDFFFTQMLEHISGTHVSIAIDIAHRNIFTLKELLKQFSSESQKKFWQNSICSADSTLFINLIASRADHKNHACLGVQTEEGKNILGAYCSLDFKLNSKGCPAIMAIALPLSDPNQLLLKKQSHILFFVNKSQLADAIKLDTIQIQNLFIPMTHILGEMNNLENTLKAWQKKHSREVSLSVLSLLLGLSKIMLKRKITAQIRNHDLSDQSTFSPLIETIYELEALRNFIVGEQTCANFSEVILFSLVEKVKKLRSQSEFLFNDFTLLLNWFTTQLGLNHNIVENQLVHATNFCEIREIVLNFDAKTIKNKLEWQVSMFELDKSLKQYMASQSYQTAYIIFLNLTRGIFINISYRNANVKRLKQFYVNVERVKSLYFLGMFASNFLLNSSIQKRRFLDLLIEIVQIKSLYYQYALQHGCPEDYKLLDMLVRKHMTHISEFIREILENVSNRTVKVILKLILGFPKRNKLIKDKDYQAIIENYLTSPDWRRTWSQNYSCHDMIDNFEQVLVLNSAIGEIKQKIERAILKGQLSEQQDLTGAVNRNIISPEELLKINELNHLLGPA